MRDRPEPGKAITVKQKITAAETALRQREKLRQSRKTDRMEMDPAAARIKKDRAMRARPAVRKIRAATAEVRKITVLLIMEIQTVEILRRAEAEPQIMDLQET